MFKELFEAKETKEYKIYYSGDHEGSMLYKAKDEKEAERKFKADKNFKVGVHVTVDTVELVEKADPVEASLKKHGYKFEKIHTNSKASAWKIFINPNNPTENDFSKAVHAIDKINGKNYYSIVNSGTSSIEIRVDYKTNEYCTTDAPCVRL